MVRPSLRGGGVLHTTCTNLCDERANDASKRTTERARDKKEPISMERGALVHVVGEGGLARGVVPEQQDEGQRGLEESASQTRTATRLAMEDSTVWCWRVALETLEWQRYSRVYDGECSARNPHDTCSSALELSIAPESSGTLETNTEILRMRKPNKNRDTKDRGQPRASERARGKGLRAARERERRRERLFSIDF